MFMSSEYLKFEVKRIRDDLFETAINCVKEEDKQKCLLDCIFKTIKRLKDLEKELENGR